MDEGNNEVVTRWLPSAWHDEMIPEPQESPDDFLFYTDKLGWHIRPPEEDEGDEDDFAFLKLEIGQIVYFDANRVFGDFELVVEADRTFRVLGDVPDEANCFRIDRDTDTLQPSLDLLVNGDEPLEDGNHAMDAYWWSETSTAFRFEFQDGKGTFVLCAGMS